MTCLGCDLEALPQDDSVKCNAVFATRMMQERCVINTSVLLPFFVDRAEQTAKESEALWTKKYNDRDAKFMSKIVRCIERTVMKLGNTHVQADIYYSLLVGMRTCTSRYSRYLFIYCF